MVHLADDTDHGQPRTENHSQTTTQRIFIGKIKPRHRFVDDDRGGGLRIVEVFRERLLFKPADQWQCNARISIAEVSALAQRDLHRAAVVAADGSRRGLLLLSLRWIRSTLDRECAAVIGMTEWGYRRGAYRFHTG